MSTATPLRRQALGAAFTAIAVAACGGGGSSSGTGTTTSASTNAALSGLSLSASGLSPAFSSTVTAYTLSVANGVSSLTVTPTLADSSASVQVNGTRVTSGSASSAITLAVGTTTISIVVTAADGSTTRTYTVVVTRDTAGLSSDATLASLVLSAGSLSPSFSAATTSYTASVSNGTASVTVTPTAGDSGATIRVNGSTVASGSASAAIALTAGSALAIPVVVTAADGSTTQTYTVTVTRAAVGSCTITATETQGPYPLLAILSNSAMVRSDIRESKTGVPLTVNLVIQDVSAGCTPVSGAAVYIWHCDKDGLYSGYDATNNAGQAGLTYLRGIQVTDASGAVSFTTIYPGWYAGRITHIHVQVYLNDNLSVTATATTQLAFPQAVTQAVYATSLYTKGQNTSVTSFAADNVFSDGTSTEMVSVTGDTTSGYTANLTIDIA